MLLLTYRGGCAREKRTPREQQKTGVMTGVEGSSTRQRGMQVKVKVKYTAPHLVAVEYRGQRGALLSSGFEFESGSYFVVEFVLRSSHLWLFAPFLCGVRTCSYGARPLFFVRTGAHGVHAHNGSVRPNAREWNRTPQLHPISVLHPVPFLELSNKVLVLGRELLKSSLLLARSTREVGT
jgi:hypothetical protein